jgi:hypothetical protein
LGLWRKEPMNSVSKRKNKKKKKKKKKKKGKKKEKKKTKKGKRNKKNRSAWQYLPLEHMFAIMTIARRLIPGMSR